MLHQLYANYMRYLIGNEVGKSNSTKRFESLIEMRYPAANHFKFVELMI